MSKGITECKVCHREFALIAEDHYVAYDPRPMGGLATLTCTDPTRQYDAIDCPHCGCQSILQDRKPGVCPCECEEEEEDEEEDEVKKDSSLPCLNEMIGWLKCFCDYNSCHDPCPLKNAKCGRGAWFGYGMSETEIIEAYKTAKKWKEEY